METECVKYLMSGHFLFFVFCFFVFFLFFWLFYVIGRSKKTEDEEQPNFCGFYAVPVT